MPPIYILKIKAIDDMIALLELDYQQYPDIETYLDINILKLHRRHELSNNG